MNYQQSFPRSTVPKQAPSKEGCKRIPASSAIGFICKTLYAPRGRCRATRFTNVPAMHVGSSVAR